jgi:hypothetical protein
MTARMVGRNERDTAGIEKAGGELDEELNETL